MKKAVALPHPAEDDEPLHSIRVAEVSKPASGSISLDIPGKRHVGVSGGQISFLARIIREKEPAEEADIWNLMPLCPWNPVLCRFG